MKRQKICIFFCGGTMVMVESPQGLVPPHEKNALQSILSFEPKLNTLADIDLKFVANIDSSDMTPVIWDKLAAGIADAYQRYDGFVVIHGTDTMAYTASALTFALQGLGKPVVFTGAQIPGDKIASDARRNLVNAVRVACMDAAEVMIVIGERLLRGVRATKTSHMKLNAFESFNAPRLGQVGREIEFLAEARRRSAAPLDLQIGFVPDIAVISLAPGMPPSVFENLLGIKGILLNAYGTGNIPHIYLPFLKKAREEGLPVVIRTQCPEGSTQMAVYETGEQALLCGAIEGFDMSLEAAATKLMWALKRADSIEEVKRIMHHNYSGEIRAPH